MIVRAAVLVVAALLTWSGPALAVPFFFSTGNTDGKIATASRPSSTGKIEIESADDFVVTGGNLSLTSATFQGLIPTGASLSSIGSVGVEIYRVFPLDSDVTRTSGAPTFSTSQVPTRVNSPSDVEFASRDSGSGGGLTFTPGILASSFTAANSVLNGIHPTPTQTTGGDLAVTGQQVQFNVIFTSPISLPDGHYFFVPQVELTSGDFFWLSAPRPIVPPGTPFPAGFTDLQSWIRNENLDPDWLRVGTDIVGVGTFNETFTLAGDLSAVPEPASMLLLGSTMAALGVVGRRRGRRRSE
ncbi:MAG TPA: PEP-CTERM sorting domain-containing protein [Gemmatimonadales bacterium]|jgi:PEP-CTERM motif